MLRRIFFYPHRGSINTVVEDSGDVHINAAMSCHNYTFFV
jgi:hypothetical protein